MWESTKKYFELKAKTVPPAEPSAGKNTCWSREQGRKDRNSCSVMTFSFDSYRRAQCGLMLISSERISTHFDTSPRPRTFHEQIDRVVLLIQIGIHQTLKREETSDMKC